MITVYITVAVNFGLLRVYDQKLCDCRDKKAEYD
jgi:hypothetical protein